MLKEVHEGICGNHSGGHALAQEILGQWYYWPTMTKDVWDYMKKCDKCQRFMLVSHLLAQPLMPIVNPWPFAI